MAVTGYDRPSGCKGLGSDSGRGGGEGRRRDDVVGDIGQELKTGDIT